MADSYFVIAVSSISLLISILAFIVALDGFEIHLETDDSNAVQLRADTIYLSGATLIGLATFGSVLESRSQIISPPEVQLDRKAF